MLLGTTERSMAEGREVQVEVGVVGKVADRLLDRTERSMARDRVVEVAACCIVTELDRMYIGDV